MTPEDVLEAATLLQRRVELLGGVKMLEERRGTDHLPPVAMLTWIMDPDENGDGTVQTLGFVSRIRLIEYLRAEASTIERRLRNLGVDL